MLTSSYFFDLSKFSHRILFENNPLPWSVLTSLESYLRSAHLGNHQGEISSDAYLIYPNLISIGEGSIIEAGAYIRGPCIIGKNSIVRHGAYIRENVLIGDHCVVGHDSELKQAILLDHAHAAHFAYVGDSILGNEVNLGAGTKLANVKLDRSEVFIRSNEEIIPTAMRKLGAIVGDKTQLGCNVVTSPGTLIGQSVRCYPCLHIEGFIPSYSLIKPSTKPIIVSY